MFCLSFWWFISYLLLFLLALGVKPDIMRHAANGALLHTLAACQEHREKQREQGRECVKERAQMDGHPLVDSVLCDVDSHLHFNFISHCTWIWITSSDVIVLDQSAALNSHTPTHTPLCPSLFPLWFLYSSQFPSISICLSYASYFSFIHSFSQFFWISHFPDRSLFPCALPYSFLILFLLSVILLLMWSVYHF